MLLYLRGRHREPDGINPGGACRHADDFGLYLAAVRAGSIGLGMAMAFVTVVLTTLIPLVLLSLLRRSGLVAG